MSNIKERPILFNTEMVQAILKGKKTQTRRTKGLDSKNQNPNSWRSDGNPINHICRFLGGIKEEDPNPIRIEFGFKHIEWVYGDYVDYMKSSYGKPGDLLYVRETWGYTAFDNTEFSNSILYKADFKEPEKAKMSLANTHWKPSLFMPKVASRIWLMIEDIKVERLQDITEEDAMAEGCIQFEKETEWMTAKGGFEILWKEINGQESWYHNPWVWVIKFKVISTTGKPNLKSTI